jgi:hypothetical protein
MALTPRQRRFFVALFVAGVIFFVAGLIVWSSEGAIESRPLPRKQEHVVVAPANLEDGVLYARFLFSGASFSSCLIGEAKPHCSLLVIDSDVSKTEAVLSEGQMLLWQGGKPDAVEWTSAIDEMWLEHLASFSGRHSWVLGKKGKRVENHSRDALLHDRKFGNYSSQRWKSEAYAFLVQPPMEDYMYENAKTAVFELRRVDPSRDVVVVLVKISEKENEILSKLRMDFSKLGAIVLDRMVLPMRDIDKQMYYRFDWQKMYVWNLPHTRVMFLDSDMVVLSSPASGFALCHAKRPVCAVQEIRNYGGYFNNGFFILNKFPPWQNEMERLLRAWWKPNAPWRQICLQDLMNEVYQKNWQALPESFNVQTVKQGILPEAWQHAVLLHYKVLDLVESVCFKSLRRTVM